jgi:hypothetical protein
MTRDNRAPGGNWTVRAIRRQSPGAMRKLGILQGCITCSLSERPGEEKSSFFLLRTHPHLRNVPS